MTPTLGASRRERRLAERAAARLAPKPRHDPATERRNARTRGALFGVVAAAVLLIGGYLAFGDFFGQRGATTAGEIGVQASMAGFTPSEIRVTAGDAVTLDFWTQDSSPHLERGVHTMISEELGIRAELPGADAVSESRVAVSFTAPMTPGRYDIYCDTCCGGKANPTMHGTIVVEA
ncbi:MAG TPA: cupredoxin domain-containing protein [Candidatus Limnocylindrales bacterium]|jgi:plastocyanin|nr:cupredoxin domain-containing protein [Candidatus Limnocylindrales bacterium]